MLLIATTTVEGGVGGVGGGGGGGGGLSTGWMFPLLDNTYPLGAVLHGCNRLRHA